MTAEATLLAVCSNLVLTICSKYWKFSSNPKKYGSTRLAAVVTRVFQSENMYNVRLKNASQPRAGRTTAFWSVSRERKYPGLWTELICWCFPATRIFHGANLCCTSPLLPAHHHVSPPFPQVLSPSCWSTAGLHRCTSISSPQAVSRPPPPNTPHYCSSLMDIDRSQWALSVSLTIWIPAPPQPYEILTPTSTGQSHGSMPLAEWGAPNFEEGGSGFLASVKSGLTSVKVLR